MKAEGKAHLDFGLSNKGHIKPMQATEASRSGFKWSKGVYHAVLL